MQQKQLKQQKQQKRKQNNMPREKKELSILDRIKEAKSYSDLVFFSADDLYGDKDSLKPTDVFKFPLYKSDDESKLKDIYNDIDYDSDIFDSLKTINIDTKVDTMSINTNLNKFYTNQCLTTEKPKYSVSEIKQKEDTRYHSFNDKNKLYDSNTEDMSLFEDKSADVDRMDGSELGTIIHSFMEHYDFKTDLKEFINDKYAKLIDYISYIEQFLSSELGMAVVRAKIEHKLYREQRFMIEMPLATVKQYMNAVGAYACGALYLRGEQYEPVVGAKFTSPFVIVQGVIDAFYLNDNGSIVLIDYKTDGLLNKKTSKDELINNYRLQLEIYEKALEQITGKKVEEKYIYSFALGKEIKI